MSPTSCQAEVLTGISLLVCKQTVGTIDSMLRNPHPMAPANPALVTVSSDELIGFRQAAGLSAAVRAAVPAPAVSTLPSSRAGKACTATRRTWLECDPAVSASAGPCPRLLCQDGEPQQPSLAWLLHTDSSDGSQGSTGEWGTPEAHKGQEPNYHFLRPGAARADPGSTAAPVVLCEHPGNSHPT